MLGLAKGSVALCSHSEDWHRLFSEEAFRIRKASAHHFLAIEHIGSTAICGLVAKPIVDIAAAVNDVALEVGCIAKLEELGYEYRGESGIRARAYFVKGQPRTHHLHVLNVASQEWRNHITFRDYLRDHRDVVEEYASLKRVLAAQYNDDREAYTEGKGAFIRDVIRRAARAARANTY
ncbi:MAG TPA: GrpB family protein [Thermoanaerobaculia bacterium]|jgi:GrpB-like predicted nucleotidyltransferase (UPF0157 family)